MFARSVFRTGAPVRQHYRMYANGANKATSGPQGTHGSGLPPQGEPKANNTVLYAAAALGVAGAGYYFLSGKPAAKKAEAKVQSAKT